VFISIQLPSSASTLKIFRDGERLAEGYFVKYIVTLFREKARTWSAELKAPLVLIAGYISKS
jgi:hypothetical protein